MRLETDKIRQTIRLLNLGYSQRKISKQISIHRSSIKNILEKLQIFPIQNDNLNAFTDRELLGFLEISRQNNYPTRKIRPDFDYINFEFKKRDMTLELLWQEYVAQYANKLSGVQDANSLLDTHDEKTLSYSRFCKLFDDFQKTKHASMRQFYKSGEALLVDFCGRTVEITSPIDGSKSYAQVFVGVLGASSYTFAYAVPSQKTKHWLECFIKTFEHIGGVPETIITDNLKSAVIKNNKSGLELQKDFEDFAAHYDFAILPTRPRKPKDKSPAEVAVQIVQRSILAALRNQKFFSIEELNRAIQEKMDIINRKTTRRFTISRFDQFNALDAKDLNPLPLYPYELCTWKRNVRVSESYRVEYLTNHYSVPYTHIHLKVDLKISNKTIHVFYEREKIAEHNLSPNTYQDYCLEEHMSPAHLAQKGLSKDEIKLWANRIGPNTSMYVERILAQKRDLARNIKSLNKFRQWVVDNQKSHCLEDACSYALQRFINTLDRLQKIIANNAYHIQDMPNELNQIQNYHQNIRGADYYLKSQGAAHA